MDAARGERAGGTGAGVGRVMGGSMPSLNDSTSASAAEDALSCLRFDWRQRIRSLPALGCLAATDRTMNENEIHPRPLVAVAVASLTCVLLVVVAFLLTGRRAGGFLVWNLFLAWLPLGFALLAERPDLRRRDRWGWAVLWVLFFPNAPYIFTDMIHVGPWRDPQVWVELGIVLLFAMTGLVVGFLSLHRMQSLVGRHYGPWAGWGVVAASCVMGAAGVAIGRFLRWNSWDALLRPLQLIKDLLRWMARLPADHHTAIFLGLFTVFLFLSYLMFHSMAALGESQSRTKGK